MIIFGVKQLNITKLQASQKRQSERNRNKENTSVTERKEDISIVSEE